MSSIPIIPIIPGISALAGQADAWICDIWGVVHNGLAAFAPAVDALVRFRAGGGSVLLLTNAPRPASAVVEQLQRLRVPAEAYDMVLTSGDLTRSEILARSGRPLAHLGPERDRGLFEGMTIELATVDKADSIICSGLYDDDNDRAEDYRQMLAGPAGRGVTMVCANPDITVARGDRVIECAGALAQLYEALGGTVIYAGKPHPPVYERAFQMLAEHRGGSVAKGRMLAIGDGLRTDIAGALGMGVPVVYVASPVHHQGPLDAAALRHLFPDGAGAGGKPVAAMAALSW